MERKGKELIKQVNTLTKESEYNSTQNKNLELMIKHMDENLQLIVRENVELRNQFNQKMAEKNEEINQMRDLAHRIIIEGDQDLFFMILDQARQNSDQNTELRVAPGFMNQAFEVTSQQKLSKRGLGAQSSSQKDNLSNSGRKDYLPDQPQTNQSNAQASRADKAVSQNSDQTRKKNSPNVSTKKDEANLIMRLAELKRENDELRKLNNQLRERFLKYSVTDSQKAKNQDRTESRVKDDESIFFTKTNHSSLADSEMMLDDLEFFNSPNSKNEVYEQVKLGQGTTKGFNFKWNKKSSKKQPKPESLEDLDDSLSRTTLRKTLGAKSSSNARARHFQHNQKPEKDIYCALV